MATTAGEGLIISPITDSPTGLYTAGLQANNRVHLPELQYANGFEPGLVSSFEAFIGSFSETARPHRLPRLSFSPVFLPTQANVNRLSFLIAWGKATEPPMPRAYKLHDYFYSNPQKVAISAVARIRHQALHAQTLDARGFVGYFTKDDSGRIIARMALGTTMRGLSTKEYTNVTDTNMDTVAADVMSELGQVQPLRFLAGVKHWPHSGYIGNEFAASSQHDLIDAI